jgi:hypothetical protein
MSQAQPPGAVERAIDVEEGRRRAGAVSRAGAETVEHGFFAGGDSNPRPLTCEVILGQKTLPRKRPAIGPKAS